MNPDLVPRLLVVDDLFGRTLDNRVNEERSNLCAVYGLCDVTGDERGKRKSDKVLNPIADAVFCRGQTPSCARVGDSVENDPQGTVDFIHQGWFAPPPGALPWSLVLLDLCFYTGQVTPDSNRRVPGMPLGRDGDDDPRNYYGLKLLELLHYELPDLPVVILSSKAREDVSRNFTLQGALGFLAREDAQSPDMLKELLYRHGLFPDATGSIVGHSRPLLLALRSARRAAFDRKCVLIRGETGTGKDLLAKYINHPSQETQSKPFVVVNSGTLSSELFLSDLFGHLKGAFTGANSARVGLIEQANGGDVFLDEIGVMAEKVQAGILRVVEDHMVVPLGSQEKGKEVDVRFISATNEDIEARASTGAGFRRDLLYRLHEGGVIFIPPLRDRKEDIPLLVETFVRHAEAELPNALRRAVDIKAVDKLANFDWPGNVRDLRNAVFAAVRNHPDVEHLVADHIQLPAADGRLAERGAPTVPLLVSINDVPTCDWGTVLHSLGTHSVDSVEAVNLPGLMPKSCILLAGVLKAALMTTRRPTVDHPEGRLLIHPAVKYATGSARISAATAADVIKRIRNLCPETKAIFGSDPVLREAYGTALRLRPSRVTRDQAPQKKLHTP